MTEIMISFVHLCYFMFLTLKILSTLVLLHKVTTLFWRVK